MFLPFRFFPRPPAPFNANLSPRRLLERGSPVMYPSSASSASASCAAPLPHWQADPALVTTHKTALLTLLSCAFGPQSQHFFLVPNQLASGTSQNQVCHSLHATHKYPLAFMRCSQKPAAHLVRNVAEALRPGMRVIIAAEAVAKAGGLQRRVWCIQERGLQVHWVRAHLQQLCAGMQSVVARGISILSKSVQAPQQKGLPRSSCLVRMLCRD